MDKREYWRGRRIANSEKIREQARARYAANPEKQKVRAREYYAANLEKVRAKARHRSKQYREVNPERVRDSNRRWMEANPEKALALRREAVRRCVSEKKSVKRWFLLNAAVDKIMNEAAPADSETKEQRYFGELITQFSQKDLHQFTAKGGEPLKITNLWRESV